MVDNPPIKAYTLTHSIWVPEPLRQEVIDALERHRAEVRASLLALERASLPAWLRKGPHGR